MNKFLAEQLLDFNKKTGDQYEENWGTILSFVHDDPQRAGSAALNAQNSGIDIFQRTMKEKEQELINERAKQDAAKKNTNNKSQATQYHKDNKERIKAMIDENSNHNITILQISSQAGQPVQVNQNFDEQEDDDETARLSRDEGSNQSIELDQSIQDLSLLQQVSFKADLKLNQENVNVSKKSIQKTSKNSIYVRTQESKQPQTPTILGYEVLEQVNKALDQMDVTPDVTDPQNTARRKLKSIVKAQNQGGALQALQQKHLEMTNQKESKNRQQQQFIIKQSSQDRIDLGQIKRRITVAPEHKRRFTQQQVQTQQDALDEQHFQQQLQNNQEYQNTNFFANLRLLAEQRNQERGINNVTSQDSPIKQLNRSASPFSTSTAQAGPDQTSLAPPVHEPINLANLRSMNLRDKLFQRLQNFNDKAEQQKLFAEQCEVDVDLDSNRMNSTQDSLFGPNDAGLGMQNPRHARTGMSFNQHGTMPKRMNKTPFLKRHGKELSQNQYMTSLMKIEADLKMSGGRKTSYFNRGAKRPSFVTSQGVHTDLTADVDHSGSNLIKSAITASFGGLNGNKSRHEKKSFMNQRFASQLRPVQKKMSEFQPNSAAKITIQQDNVSMHGEQPAHEFIGQRIRFPGSISGTTAPQAQNQSFIYKNQRKIVFARAAANYKKQHLKSGSFSVPQYRTAQQFYNNDLHTESSRHDEDGQPIESKEQSFRRDDSDDEMDGFYNPAAQNLVHVPNQSNSFFASGFKMIDPNRGDLERVYQGSYKRERVRAQSLQTQHKIYQQYDQGKPDIDRTNQILKSLQRQTPASNVNLGQIKKIQTKAKDRVSYTYKERYNGIYCEMQRTGQLKKENSWEKFINPDKIGIDNYMQHALNSDAAEQVKGDEEEEQQPQQHMTSQGSHRSVKDGASDHELSQRPKNVPPRTKFRNALERFQYQFDGERFSNINDNTTFERFQKANKRFDDVIERAKPSIKLFNLLGYSKTQFLLVNQIRSWLENHKYSTKKQSDNANNVKFAREFFQIIDDNDSGQASLHELAVPMIALGLSSDSSFIMKVMKAVSPYKFGKKAKVKNPFEVCQLTLREFIKIFKKDQVSENLTEMLCKKIIQRRLLEQIEKKRSIERRQKQLQIIKGGTFTVVQPSTPPADETVKAQQLDIGIGQNALQWLDIAGAEEAESQDLEAFQRQDSEKSAVKNESIAGVSPGKINKGASGMSQYTESKIVTFDQMTEAEIVKQFSSITINDMLSEVRGIWFELDQERGQLELDLLIVCQFFCQFQVLPDVSSAEKYIKTSIQNKKTKVLDYDDFNSIFCKGIFKHAIVSKSHQIEQDTALNPHSNPEEKLEFKMERSKIKILQAELNLGRIEHVDEPAQYVKRPILSQLWQMIFKDIPKEKQESYEQFFNRMQGLTDEIRMDPTSVQLDAFSDKIRADQPVPDRGTMSMVSQHHFEIAQSPYEQEEIVPVKVQSKPGTSATQTSSQRANRMKRKQTIKSRTVSGVSVDESNRRSSGKKKHETKSQVSNKPEAQGNMSSHRTLASSQKQVGKSSTARSNVKFDSTYENESYQNLDLKLSDDPEELMMQRKARFDKLRELQGLMEMTDLPKPPGTDFLEAIYKRKEDEKKERLEKAAKGNF